MLCSPFLTVQKVIYYCCQGWGARAGQSQVFLALWSWSRLKKKTGAGATWKKKSGAEAAKKLAGSFALREDKKHKEIVL